MVSLQPLTLMLKQKNVCLKNNAVLVKSVAEQEARAADFLKCNRRQKLLLHVKLQEEYAVINARRTAEQETLITFRQSLAKMIKPNRRKRMLKKKNKIGRKKQKKLRKAAKIQP